MSQSSQFVSESLAELLTSIADGVREAQEALSHLPAYDRYGRALPSYHLPYLDFQIQVDMQTEETQQGSKFLRVLPSRQASSQSNVSSTLSGRFVSVPAGDGMPMPIIQLTTVKNRTNEFSVQVQLSNSAGEIITGARIELNLDTELSRVLSQSNNIPFTGLKNSRLEQSVVTTNAQGFAQINLTLDAQLAAKTQVVITADYGLVTVQASVSAGAN